MQRFLLITCLKFGQNNEHIATEYVHWKQEKLGEKSKIDWFFARYNICIDPPKKQQQRTMFSAGSYITYVWYGWFIHTCVCLWWKHAHCLTALDILFWQFHQYGNCGECTCIHWTGLPEWWNDVLTLIFICQLNCLLQLLSAVIKELNWWLIKYIHYAIIRSSDYD